MSKSFFPLLKNTSPLKIVGAVNAYSALLAERAGLKALYISGAGVANASYGIPDFLIDAVSKTVKDMILAGANGIHIEDQVSNKRCGHRPNKEIVSDSEMMDRIKAAKDSSVNDFMLMARTDAFAQEGIEREIERSNSLNQN